MVTKNVWYRSTPGSVIEDRGKASFDGETFSFRGRRHEVGGPVLAAGRRAVGMRSWVQVQYRADGEVREAFLLVKDLFGWMGLLGGNDRLLAAALEAAKASSQGGDPDAEGGPSDPV